jgi:hypothetical protein
MRCCFIQFIVPLSTFQFFPVDATACIYTIPVASDDLALLGSISLLVETDALNIMGVTRADGLGVFATVMHHLEYASGGKQQPGEVLQSRMELR